MFTRRDDKILYFSTKVELKIDGVTYRPSICYKVPALSKASLKKYEAAGKVTLYENPVRFVNGIVTYMPTEQVSNVPSVVKETDTEKYTRRKNK